MPWNFYGKPRLDHDDITEQDLVLEGCPESALRSAEALLDLSPDPRHRPDCRTLKLGHFQAGVEHALDEGRLFEYLEGHRGSCSNLAHFSQIMIGYLEFGNS